VKYTEHIYSPQFREVFLTLDEIAQIRIADSVFRLQRGEIEGVTNGMTLEIETEAGEIISYEIKQNNIILLDLHIIK